MIPRHHVPKMVMTALEATGDFALKRGKKHIHLYVKGQFCGIVPLCVQGDGMSRFHACRNVVASIRRAAR